MVRDVGMALLVLMLAGCAAPADQAWWRGLVGRAPVPAQFHFDWQIDGDPTLAPLQVFDDGQRTWLQYPAAQPVPALFARTPAGDRLLRARREGDYLVVPEVPARLALRGGHLQAEAWRAAGPGDAPAGVDPAAFAEIPGVSAPQALPVAAAGGASAAGHVLPLAALPAAAAPPAAPAPGKPLAAADAVRPVDLPRTAAPAALYEASPADGNIRRALGRWARRAGWTFTAEHWAVDVDIPLAGSAAFGTDFVPAVRDLLAATELGDRPLQPCFYANRVLRVVPLAQRCDRTQAPGASS